MQEAEGKKQEKAERSKVKAESKKQEELKARKAEGSKLKVQSNSKASRR